MLSTPTAQLGYDSFIASSGSAATTATRTAMSPPNSSSSGNYSTNNFPPTRNRGFGSSIIAAGVAGRISSITSDNTKRARIRSPPPPPPAMASTSPADHARGMSRSTMVSSRTRTAMVIDSPPAPPPTTTAMTPLRTTTAAGAAPASSAGRPRASSDFDLCMMPHDRIVKRILYPWSVHHSVSTGHWIATISRPEQIIPPSPYDMMNNMNNNSNNNNVNNHWNHQQQQHQQQQQQPPSQPQPKLKYLQFSFPTEREAKKFCEAYTPPKPQPYAANNNFACRMCDTNVCNRHCRNCGVPMCERCSIRWGCKMVPKTYITSTAHTVRVCKSCDWLSNAFCLALLQGRYEDAKTIHSTGNVNLRTSFADIHREAMFPIHCAVMGGSIDVVRWLVEKQLCPISVKRDKNNSLKMLSVQTSANRTLLDLAMTGRPKLEVLMYLIRKGLCIDDMKDQSLATKTLETILKIGGIQAVAMPPPPPSFTTSRMNCDDDDDDNNNNINHSGTTSTTTMNVREINIVPAVNDYDESVATVTTLDPDDERTNEDNACKLCCERGMDCVLQPCGHQMCCADCGTKLSKCPICKVDCTVLRIFRQ